MMSIMQARRRTVACSSTPTSALLLRVLFASMVATLFTSMFSPAAVAFDNLTEAQTLVYDTPHLANTQSGQTVSYTYTADIPATAPEGGKLNDKVVLSVLNEQEDNKRDVSIEFLSGQHRLPLPDFKAYKGNPVIIAMLEHVAISMGRDTGGGALYFRNRIKDGLAREGLKISTVTVQHKDKKINARQFSFNPFANDSYLIERPEYTGAVFTFTLSDEVPGGVLELRVNSTEAAQDGFQHSLTLD